MDLNIEVSVLIKTKTNGWNNAISKQYTNNTYLLCGSRCKAVSNWKHLYF